MLRISPVICAVVVRVISEYDQIKMVLATLRRLPAEYNCISKLTANVRFKNFRAIR